MALSLIRDKRFGAFFWTQFLGAFNDNLLKFAVTLAVTYNDALRGDWSAGLLVNLIAGLFILPFVIFSATSGQLADKYDKTKVMRLAKWLEPFIVLITGVGFLLNSVELLVVAVFLLGSQAAFFGPAKYAYLPDQLKPHELVMANAVVESATFMAILLGTIAAGSLMSADAGHTVVYVVCGFGFVVALTGVWSAHRMPLTPSHSPQLVVNWNVISETWRNVRFATRLSAVWPSLLGISWLWFVGATYLTQFPLLTQTVFNASAGVATVLLFSFTVGLGIGAFWCEKLSHKRIEMGLVLIGLMIMVIAGLLLHGVLVTYTSVGSQQGVLLFFSQLPNLAILLLFVAISAGVGLYSVPLYSTMQALAPKDARSRVVSANNIVNSFFMVVSAGFAITILLATRGQVVWVFSAVTALNAVALGLWWFKQPYVVLRAALLFKVRRRNLPQLADVDHLGDPGGHLIVFPTLLHENYLYRMAGLPLEMTVVLSGRLKSSGFVEWLRKRRFILEFTKLSEVDAQKELIRQIATHMQEERSIAIDKPMYELLRKQYRLDDMPAVLAKKGISMGILEFHEELKNDHAISQPIWRLSKRMLQPAQGM
ncbi:MAG TPA: MFS transporter [Limnobacter sp.]|uniref:MFS transporter n=1 Tax=Limnobacter sp. TaxID=2003368 RepID=UPI002EDA8003